MRRISGHSLIFIRETSDKRKLTKEKDATCVYACYSRDLDSPFPGHLSVNWGHPGQIHAHSHMGARRKRVKVEVRKMSVLC